MTPSLMEKMRRVDQSTLLILLLSTLVAGTAVLVAVLVLSDASVSEGSSSAQAGLDSLGRNSNELAEPADGEATPIDEQRPSSRQSQGAESDSTSGLNTSDTVDSAVAEACSQFRSGSTVDKVAKWFESEWESNSVGVEASFREVIEQALTRECPDVVPSD